MSERTLTVTDLGLASVPIAMIRGSVGKATLFTSSFNPRSDELRTRWKTAYAAAHGLVGYEPIELYQIEEVFYVLDGHFRVSVTRYLGGESIEAHIQVWTSRPDTRVT